MNFWGFDGKRSRGSLVVNASIADEAAAAFTRLYELQFRIRQMKPMDSSWGHNPKGPGANDYAAMEADNTSAFNCRYVGGQEASKVYSKHAYGTAIDVNDFENPYVADNGTVYPDRYWLSRRGPGARRLLVQRQRGRARVHQPGPALGRPVDHTPTTSTSTDEPGVLPPRGRVLPCRPRRAARSSALAGCAAASRQAAPPTSASRPPPLVVDHDDRADDHDATHHDHDAGPQAASRPRRTRTADAEPDAQPPKPSPKPSPKPQRPRRPARSRPGSRAAQVVLVRSSGSSATVRACRRTGRRLRRWTSGPTTATSAATASAGPSARATSRPRRARSRCAGVSVCAANPGLPQGGSGSTAPTSGSTTAPSSLYNTHQRKPANGRWTSAENLLNTPGLQLRPGRSATTSRARPGKGSAIFFHVDTGGGTAGCVSLPTVGAAGRDAVGALRRRHVDQLSQSAC